MTDNIVLNEMIDVIEILFKEITSPYKRHWEDQIEFEADISNRIDTLKDMVKYAND